MNTCPSCSAENLEGVDNCSECGNSLASFHLSEPTDFVERALLEDRLTDLSPSKPVCVSPDCTVREAIQLLIDRHIGSVIVTDGDRVIGIFSERDALMKLNTDAPYLHDRPVSEFMTQSPRTLVADAKVAFALKEMDLGGYRHIPVVDDKDRLTGVVSIRDLLRYLTSKMSISE